MMTASSKSQRTPPPGMEIVKEGRAMEGDYFFIEQFGAWAPVPKKYWGAEIEGRIVARGTPDFSNVKIGFESQTPEQN